MKSIEINFASDFTDCPGGRLKIYGEHSGEEFRCDVLAPALKKYDEVVLNLNGVLGFPASFLDEAFGVLVDEIGVKIIKSKLKIILDDNTIALSEIDDCIAKHAT